MMAFRLVFLYIYYTIYHYIYTYTYFHELIDIQERNKSQGFYMFLPKAPRNLGKNQERM